MARTPSTMPPLGIEAPDFALPDTEGRTIRRDDLPERPGLLIMFICNHCPFVIHVQGELAKLGRDYGDRINIIAINSNDISAHPADAPDKMREEKAKAGYPFPYLFDETQQVARAYGAACTPDFFLYDQHQRLYYRGQLDSSRPGNNTPVNGHDLRDALDRLLDNQPAPEPQHPSLGCNIKWKPGNEP